MGRNYEITDSTAKGEEKGTLYVDHNPWLAKMLCTLVLRNNFPKINAAFITWFSVTMDTLKQLKH